MSRGAVPATATATGAHAAQKRALVALLSTFALILVWSAVRPHDYFTWFLEVWPAMAGIAALAAIYPRFRFTTLVNGFIWAHAVILLVGGHYTYAEVPLFNWIRDHWHLARNDYDRVGHFAQGFVPALIAREVLIRRRIVNARGWVFFIVLCICVAISASYELLEWRVAVASGSAADAFLGTQGDPWDTQEDMATALVGALCALVFLSRWHDRQIERMEMAAVSR
jgi:putative membrane protein